VGYAGEGPGYPAGLCSKGGPGKGDCDQHLMG